jgi:NAD(P)-dependent dehydrogenase (short-subunit alcohol dehydrogenase family)
MVDAFAGVGARVHICDVVAEHLADCQQATGTWGTLADVGDPAQVERWFADAQSVLGGLDVLINNAGISGPTGFLEEISIEDWRRTLAVDLDGMFYCARLAIPLLKAAAAEHGDAAMINLSSTAGRFGFAQRAPYAAAKWAVVGLTETLSLELGPHGVRVNAIQPGTTASERSERTIVAKAASTGRSAEEIRGQMLAVMALRRFVPPEDIASTALFLASPLARSIAGQTLSVCADTLKMW